MGRLHVWEETRSKAEDARGTSRVRGARTCASVDDIWMRHGKKISYDPKYARPATLKLIKIYN
jgi:hypothetical protein